MINNKNYPAAKALVMCLADPSGDPRPRRAVELCSSVGFDVSVMGYPLKQLLVAQSYFTLPYPSPYLPYKILRRLCAAMRLCLPFEAGRIFCEQTFYGLTKIKKTLAKSKFDLLVVEDLQLLPFAFSIKGEAKIIFDAREYYPRQNEGEIWFDLFEKQRRVQLCRKYLSRCDAVVTVSEGLQREYQKEFGVVAEVYRSTPSYLDFRTHLTDTKKIRIVYHGAANRNRRLENLIEVVLLLDNRFSLDLILVGNPRYQLEVRRKAASIKNVSFLDPVSITAIIPTIAQYDIGFCYFEPTTFNLQNCLPNKFFEYIQARLMIAIGPTPDMANLVKEYGCGVVAESFSVKDMANALNALTVEDINRCKQQSDRAARELCFEKEREKMIAVMDRLLDKHVALREE